MTSGKERNNIGQILQILSSGHPVGCKPPGRKTIYQVFFIGVGSEDVLANSDRVSDLWQQLSDVLAEQIGPHDMNLKYTPARNIVALFDQTPEQAEEFIRRIRKNCPSVAVEMLS